MGSIARKSTGRDFPDLGTVIDVAGLPVNCSGSVWRLNSAASVKTISWRNLPIQSSGLLLATAQYMQHLVETHSASHVYNTFSALRSLTTSEVFQAADRNDDVIGFDLFSELRQSLVPNVWRLHYIRQWYGWCSAFAHSNFSPDVSFQADQLRIPGNDKGQAVLSLDLEEGPLSDVELAALLTKLRAARLGESLAIEHQAALWLCIALGPNPMQMAMLAEEDLVAFADGGEIPFRHLRVPRMKKRENEARSDFRNRGLTPEIAEVVLALRQQNQERFSVAESLDNRSRPLFRRERPRSDLIGGPLDFYAWHLEAREFTHLVQAASTALGVISPRTGKLLKVTTRRLRYTFATRLVREGVPKLEVADLLDHTDTQNVQVYFDIKSDIVEHLDRAMAMALAPMAQAFMGTLVRDQTEAVRGGDPESGIATVAGTPGHVEKLGNCGSFSFCGAMAPIACYTCRSFQPWMDAPHGMILDDLIKDRERKVAAGLDGRMVSMHDTTISAIAEVILRIDQAKGATA